MINYQVTAFWARAKGKPLTSAQGEIIGIRGVFQKIDPNQISEQQHTKSVQLIEDQHTRIYDFAPLAS